MYLNLALLAVLAFVVVALTRMLVRGIEILAAAGVMSAKAKGQFLGYATSMPELVGTVGTAGYGLLKAGLWNIAASNIINVSLFLLAAIYYRRIKMVWQRKFVDEIVFALVAFGVPLVLSRYGFLASSPFTAVALFGGFLVYLWLDKRFNPDPPQSFSMAKPTRVRRSQRQAMLFILGGVGGIVVLGHFLGAVAERVVVQAGVPEVAVGWLLGVITSLPEMTAFFAVFASASEHGGPIDDTDCQENLDSLAASNMSNLGLIYPLGIAVFLFLGS